MIRTRFVLVVLSEDPIDDEMDLAAIIRECDEGDYVLHSCAHSTVKVSRKHMAELLVESGSDPEFFGIDSEGRVVEG